MAAPQEEFVIYTDMVGDLFHYGHMRFIQQVRKAAQELFPHQRIHIIVGVTADVHLQEYKRKRRGSETNIHILNPIKRSKISKISCFVAVYGDTAWCNVYTK